MTDAVVLVRLLMSLLLEVKVGALPVFSPWKVSEVVPLPVSSAVKVMSALTMVAPRGIPRFGKRMPMV